MLDEVVGARPLSAIDSLIPTQALIGNVELLSRPVEDDVQSTSLTALAKIGLAASGGGESSSDWTGNLVTVPAVTSISP